MHRCSFTLLPPLPTRRPVVLFLAALSSNPSVHGSPQASLPGIAFRSSGLIKKTSLYVERDTSLAFELPSLLAVASSEMEPSRRVVGKRQVRPNMARQDFGYVERSRAAANKGMKGVKPKREDEEDGSAPMRSEKDARSLVRAPSPPIAGRATRHRPCSVLTPARPAAARRSTSQNWTWLR